MADWQWGDQFGDDDEDENEEGGGPRYQWGTRDGLIFLVDASEAMFQGNVGGDDDQMVPFQLCLKCAKSVIQNKIISSEKDLLGVVFYGTEKTKNPSEFKHVYILHEIGQSGADEVLELENFIDQEDVHTEFRDMYGWNKAYSLSDALWTCSNMFSNCTQKLGFKRVMLFTNNDNPHSNNAQLRRQAVTKAEDLHQNGIEIELMHINADGKVFDPNVFYKDLLITDDDENVQLADPAEKFEELLTRVRSKDHKKRAQARVSLSLGGDLNLSVGVYNLVRTCYKPAAVKLYKKTNEEAKSVTKQFLDETGEVLLPQDMKKAQNYAGRQICFEQEEVKQIKTFDSSGLSLMGFKPQSSIKRYFHVKPAQFIYPDENTVDGSTCLFSALLRKTLDRDVVAICKYIPRKNTAPRFVALVPQNEESDEHGVQVAPPGFHVIFLPFADDFRKVKLDEDLPRANTDQIDKAKELIKKLQFKFMSDSFENPALQTHYANLEAMALDRDAPDKVEDLTMPDSERMQKRAGKIMEDFKDLVFPEGYTPGAKKAGGGGAKKPKLEIDMDVEAEARAGRLSKLTVPILKQFCQAKKLNAAGTKKQNYIDAITEHLEL